MRGATSSAGVERSADVPEEFRDRLIRTGYLETDSKGPSRPPSVPTMRLPDILTIQTRGRGRHCVARGPTNLGAESIVTQGHLMTLQFGESVGR